MSLKSTKSVDLGCSEHSTHMLSWDDDAPTSSNVVLCGSQGVKRKLDNKDGRDPSQLSKKQLAKRIKHLLQQKLSEKLLQTPKGEFPHGAPEEHRNHWENCDNPKCAHCSCIRLAERWFHRSSV